MSSWKTGHLTEVEASDINGLPHTMQFEILLRKLSQGLTSDLLIPGGVTTDVWVDTQNPEMFTQTWGGAL